MAGERIRTVYKKMVALGSDIDDTSPAEDLHELRKRGKELRYLLEFFGGLWPSSVAKPMVKTLKGLQDVLGTHQDREVQADHLRSLADELAGVVGGPRRCWCWACWSTGWGRAAGGPATSPSGSRPSPPRPAQAGGGHLPGAGRVKVLATYNIKGGVGKTSAAVNVAALAAADGLRTLLWDLDPQGAASFLFRVRPKVRGGGRKLVRGRSDVTDVLRGTDVEGLDLLPADFSYRHMDLALDATGKPTRRLRRSWPRWRSTTTWP